MAKVIDVDTESLICLSKQYGTADGSPALGKDRDYFEYEDEYEYEYEDEYEDEELW